MENPENANISDANTAQNHTVQPPVEAVPVPGIDLPGTGTVKQPRNQHLRVDAPKNKQFSARCTETEHQIISSAMRANGCTDIVQLMLYSIKLHQKDIISSFKLK